MAFFKKGQLIERSQSIVTSGGTTALLVNSPKETSFTGTQNQDVTLPNATTLTINQVFSIRNMGDGTISVKDFTGTLLMEIATGIQIDFHIMDISTAAGVWEAPLSGAGGSGDASSVLEALLDGLECAPFKYMTPNVFSQQEDTLINPSSTATLKKSDGIYEFTTGQVLTSLQLYTSEELSKDTNNSQAELRAFWNVIDTAAAYEISQNGGVDWTVIAMTRVGATNLYRGLLKFPTPATLTALASYSTAVTPATFDFTATGNNQANAMPFAITGKQRVQKIQLQVTKTGSPVGSLTARIVKDNAGQPSMAPADLVAELPQTLMSSIASGNSTVEILAETVLLTGNYWIVWGTDGVYKSSYVNSTTELTIRGDSAETYPGGALSQFNGTAWATVAGGAALFAVQGITMDLRVRITASMTSSLLGYGVYTGETGTSTIGMKNEPYKEVFSSIQDKYTFTLPFLPTTNLKVFNANNEKAYSYPKFALNGFDVIFAPGTFFDPSTINTTLHFVEPTNVGYDNSDVNASLMAANGLGSTNATIDRSAPGVGVKLRDGDGALKEYAADSNGGIVVRDPATATAIGYIEPTADNGLYNTDFFYTQRNEAKTYSGLSGYLADRWFRSNAGGTNPPNFTQVVANPATGIHSSIRVGRVSGNSDVNQQNFIQPLTTKDSIKYAGKTVCLSLLLKKGANFSGTNFTARMVFGQGVDQSVGLVWTNATVINPLVIPSASISTSAFQKFYVVVQVPAATTQIGFNFIYTPVGTAGAADYVEITQVMFHEGNAPAKWQLKGKTYSGELILCEEFYEKSYNIGVNPGTVGTEGAIQVQRAMNTATDNFSNRFRTRKRANTAVNTVYSTGGTGAAANIRDQSAAADRAATISQAGSTGFSVSAAVQTGSPHAWHYTSDAEL